jgi:hypothetical protein
MTTTIFLSTEVYEAMGKSSLYGMNDDGATPVPGGMEVHVPDENAKRLAQITNPGETPDQTMRRLLAKLGHLRTH